VKRPFPKTTEHFLGGESFIYTICRVYLVGEI